MLYGDIFSQRLTLVNTHVVADTIDYLEVKFFFKTNDWDGLEKWVHFANSERVYDIRLSEDGVQKEDHLNLTAGKWRVYLHGNRYENGQVIERITTDEAVIYVEPTGTLDGEPFPEMPASVTEQILARLENVEQNGGGGSGGGISHETDPTVPSWAKEPEKPTYTAEEVGALPADTRIPKKTSDLENDSGYITISVATLLNYYLKTEVYAKTEAYNREEVDSLISGLSKRLNAVADSTDVDLDQLSEIVAYIKSNKSLIDSITTSKVSVADIINNLATSDAKKPLSAAQGKVLKDMYDALPGWAKESVKPSYTKAEIGLGNVDNVRQYSAQNPPPYPVTSVNGMAGAVMLNANHVRARPETWMPSASEVGADPSGTADSKVSAHNVSETSHNDIRLLITGLTNRLNALANSTDDDLDQLAEIVAYIKANKSLIDGITTSKVSVVDIIDNLTTNASNKPLSAKMGVQLKALIDAIKIPTTLPASDVYDWAKQPDPPKYTAADVGAATKKQVDDLSETIVNQREQFDTLSGAVTEEFSAQRTLIDSKQPKGDYLTEIPAEYVTGAELNSEIANLKAQGIQQTPLYAESVEWLNDNGDESKVYVLPDGYIYAYKATITPGGKPLFTNRLPLAIDSDGTPYNGGLGYKNWSYITSAGVETAEGTNSVACTGFIACNKGDTIRFKDMPTTSKRSNMAIPFKTDFTKYGNPSYFSSLTPDADGVYTFTANLSSSSGYIRMNTDIPGTNPIVTVNEEIKYSAPEVVYGWANTGRSFTPADYEDRIVSIESTLNDNTGRISTLETKVENLRKTSDERTEAELITSFRYWDRAIYDKVETITVADEGMETITAEMRTSATIYAKYDALMSEVYPEGYITKTLMGKDEADYDVYRYDFKMPEQPHSGNNALSKDVPKVILVSGVHVEWAGVYALYNTMREIAMNPELVDLKRNIHFIVLPMVNAYSCNGGGRKNINGVDIARNFEVDFDKNDSTPDANTYGGAEPLSELEAQYVDKIMKDNTDAWFFVSCHNFDEASDENNAMWGAGGTRYFSNLCQKLIDKLTRAWADKYDFIPKNTYLGHTEVSAPFGSEGRQAAKYAIQGGTLECRHNFPYHSATKYTAFSMSRATEVYINFLLTAFGNFEATDKRELKDFHGKL